MALSPGQLRVELHRAGIANAAIDAVWPQWWSSDAEGSLSARAELTFTVARRLGLSPRALLDGEARFIWRDETKFKHLRTKATEEEAAVSAFGLAVARVALQGLVSAPESARPSAMELRASILASAPVVDVLGLLSVAWGLGTPVLQLHVFPLPKKRMHAMSAGIQSRSAILLARADSYAAPVAFTLAHELGHVMLGHLDETGTLIDSEDPLRAPPTDDAEELAADRFALELLTGQPSPEVVSDSRGFSASELARAVQRQGPAMGIEPGVLAMCAGYSTGQWDKAYGALKIIPPGQLDMAVTVNRIARSQLNWSALSVDNQDYLQAVLALPVANV
jgi:hypothetical protein